MTRMPVKCLGRSVRTAVPVLMAAGLLAIAPGRADAQGQYPTRPIRFIVPFAPGGGNDLVARVIAQKLTETMGQQVIADNRAGSGGVIGTQMAAQATPDGYTLLLGYTGTLAINPSLYKNIPYDPVRDFAPVALAAATALVLVIHPAVPAQTISELIALAKSKPGSLNYASGGTGTGSHLSGEMFKSMAGVNMVLIPYKGTGPAITELIAGQTQVMFSVVPSAVPHIKSKRLRALGVTSLKRSVLMPELPTIAESGLAGYESVLRYGVTAPQRTPAPIISRLSGEIVRIMALPDVRDILLSSGAEPTPGSPEEYGKLIRLELALWSKVIAAAGIKPE